MKMNVARHGFALIVVAACIGAAIRVATAPDRIKERRQTAKQVCASTGGSWVRAEDGEICVAADGKPK